MTFNCSNCGKPVDEGERFCQNCGENNERYNPSMDTSKIEVKHTMNAVDQLSELTGIDSETLKQNNVGIPDDMRQGEDRKHHEELNNQAEIEAFGLDLNNPDAFASEFNDTFVSKKELKKQAKLAAKKAKLEAKAEKKNKKKALYETEDF